MCLNRYTHIAKATFVNTMNDMTTNPDFHKTMVNASRHDKEIILRNSYTYSALQRRLVKQFIKDKGLL